MLYKFDIVLYIVLIALIVFGVVLIAANVKVYQHKSHTVLGTHILEGQINGTK